MTQRASLSTGWNLKHGKGSPLLLCDPLKHLTDVEDLLPFRSQFPATDPSRQEGMKAADEWWRLFTSWWWTKKLTAQQEAGEALT